MQWILRKLSFIKKVLLIMILDALLSVPLFSSDFTMTMIIRYMYYGLLTVSYGFLTGELGLFSLMALDHGRLIRVGTPAQIQKDPEVQKIYKLH